MAFPINCEVKVTVEDDENPTLDCPADFTFNLQGGECSETITFNEPEIMDNCGAEVAAQLPNICDNSLAATNNWNIQCTGATTGITMAMDMSGFGSVALGQVCFLQANPFWAASPTIEINIYDDQGIVPFNEGPQAPLYTETQPFAAAPLGTVFCFDLAQPLVIDAAVNQLYIEIVWVSPTAGLFTGGPAFSASCDGLSTAAAVTASQNTYISCSTTGVPGSGALFGTLAALGFPRGPAVNVVFESAVLKSETQLLTLSSQEDQPPWTSLQELDRWLLSGTQSPQDLQQSPPLKIIDTSSTQAHTLLFTERHPMQLKASNLDNLFSMNTYQKILLLVQTSSLTCGMLAK
jgi:hypothetical protein